MTAVAVSLTGAFSTSAKWDSINWKNTEAEVHRLQMRIAKAVSEGRHGKVKALQGQSTAMATDALVTCQAIGGKTSCTKQRG